MVRANHRGSNLCSLLLACALVVAQVETQKEVKMRLSKIKRRLIKEGRLCYKKWEEVGLWYEIKTLKDVIKNKASRNEDCRFEKKLLKSYSQYTEASYSEEFSS